MSIALRPSFRTLLASGLSRERRGTRVLILLIGVVLLSLADLYMTLEHLMNFGLLEGNPVAREIMAHGSPAAVILWKLVTVGFAVGVLFWARRRAAAEAAAVFCCLVLTWLTCRWSAYNDQVSRLTQGLDELGAVDEPRWVTMAPGE
jgi:Domain of unknown function (DUF5658)